MKQNEFYKRFEIFLRNLKFEDKIFLVFDKDADGVSSGVLTLHAFEKMGIEFSKIFPSFFKESIPNMKKFSAGVVVDVPASLQKKFLLTTRKKMLIIDHHPSDDLESENISFINPRLIKKGIYQPTSYTAYNLFSDFVDLKKEKWIAIVGTVGDYAFSDVQDLYKNEVDARKKEEIWMTKYGRASTRLNATIVVEGPLKAFNILSKCRSLDDFSKNGKVTEAYKKYSNEFWRINKEIKLEFYPNGLIFAGIKSKYRSMQSAVSSRLSTKYPKKLILIAAKEGKTYRISARMQSGKFDVGKLMAEFGGGGHRQAAACTVKGKEIDIFKERLIKIVGKMK